MQAYCWPILRRGRELVAVTDSFYMEGRDGVSLTYLMALATLLLDKDNYKHLPDGNGVQCHILFVVIFIYSMFNKLLRTIVSPSSYLKAQPNCC